MSGVICLSLLRGQWLVSNVGCNEVVLHSTPAPNRKMQFQLADAFRTDTPQAPSGEWDFIFQVASSASALRVCVPYISLSPVRCGAKYVACLYSNESVCVFSLFYHNHNTATPLRRWEMPSVIGCRSGKNSEQDGIRNCFSVRPGVQLVRLHRFVQPCPYPSPLPFCGSIDLQSKRTVSSCIDPNALVAFFSVWRKVTTSHAALQLGWIVIHFLLATCQWQCCCGHPTVCEFVCVFITKKAQREGAKFYNNMFVSRYGSETGRQDEGSSRCNRLMKLNMEKVTFFIWSILPFTAHTHTCTYCILGPEWWAARDDMESYEMVIAVSSCREI